jgi:hypothetical protein
MLTRLNHFFLLARSVLAKAEMPDYGIQTAVR